MSAHGKTKPLPDVEAFLQQQVITIEILQAQHDALFKIANDENSAENGLIHRTLAIDTIFYCNQIAETAEAEYA